MARTKKKKLEKYMVGDTDDKASVITRIYIKNANHIIYEINDSGDIGMMMADPSIYPWKAISSHTARISTLLRSRKEKKAFLSNMAKAYHDFFSGNSSSAVALLQTIERDIIKHKQVAGKLNYLITGLILVVNICVLVMVFSFVPVMQAYHEWKMMFYMAAFGSFGGFLSISFRINKLKLDLEGGSLFPRLTAISRIFIAILSSFIVMAVIRSNLIFGVMNDPANPYIYYTLAVLAGFSESFIPNILHQIEKRDVD